MSLNMVVPPPNVDFSTEAGESNDSTYPAVPNGRQITFSPLPTNPAELTAEHARLLFAGDATAILRQLARLALESGGDHA